MVRILRVPATIVLYGVLSMAAAQEKERPAPPVSSIGYASVADALKGICANDTVTITQRDGWTIATEADGMILWSFVPKDHAAYPAVVRRAIASHDGAYYVEMKVLCEAKKSACDKLVGDFEAMNEQMRKELARPKPRN